MWFRELLALTATVLSSAAPVVARAQAVGPGAATGVQGTVVSEAGGRPLAGVQVMLQPGDRTTTTDSAGRFRLVGVEPGDKTMIVRAISFDPVSAFVTVERGRVLEADVELRAARPQTLDEVRVTTDSQRWGPLAGLERRRAAGSGGKFIGRATLDSAKGRALSDVVRGRLQGARIVNYARAGAELLSSSRGQTSLTQLPRADPFDPTSPRACFSQVYLDGVRLYAPSATAGSPAPDLRSIRPETLEAVEYYSGPAVTPPEFGGTGAQCGTLVIWTRAR